MSKQLVKLRSRLFKKPQKTPSLYWHVHLRTPSYGQHLGGQACPSSSHLCLPESLQFTPIAGLFHLLSLPPFSHGWIPIIRCRFRCHLHREAFSEQSDLERVTHHHPALISPQHLQLPDIFHLVYLSTLCLPTGLERKLHKGRNTVCLVYSSITSTSNRAHHRASAP